MKTYIGALALLSLIPLARAESGVSIFGTADIGLRSVKLGSSGSITTVTSNGLSTSKLGFKGEEALGGGSYAGFWLESGFLPDTGAMSDSTKFFNRRSTVSLGSARYGELRIGRDYTPTYSALSASGPFGDTGLGAISNIANVVSSGARTFTRADNQVAYFLPSMNGVTGAVAFALGEGVAGARYRGGNLGYAQGPMRLLVGVGRTAAVAGDFTQWIATGSYDLVAATLYGAYVRGTYRTNRQSTYQVAVGIPVGNGLVKASYTIGDMQGPTVAGAAVSDADDVKRIAIGYTYNLSKRTALYTTAVRLQNQGRSAFSLAAAPAGYFPGQSNTGFDVGIRHNF